MRLEVKTGFKGMDFDFRRFKKSLQVNLERRRNAAMREFLKPLVANIPVRTGSAKGTLRPLGRLVNMAIAIHPIEFQPGRGPSVFDNPRYSRVRADKIKEGDTKAEFHWELRLDYFIYNDLFAAPDEYHYPQYPTPWKLIQDGQNAAREYLADFSKHVVPRISQFIKVRK